MIKSSTEREASQEWEKKWSEHRGTDSTRGY